MSRVPVIAGVGLSDYPIAPHLTAYGHHTQAIARALDDAGLQKSDIDGYMSVGVGGPLVEGVTVLAELFNVKYRWAESAQFGGASFEVFIEHAAEIIRAGICETILLSYGSDLRSNKQRTLGMAGGGRIEGPSGYEAPYGPTIAGCYALAAQRHMYEFGTTLEQLAEVAVSSRLHAANNPLALNRQAITIEQVIGAPRIADPLGKLDCCVVSDGGGAIILTTAQRARDLRQRPIHVLGAATAQTHWHTSQMPDFTTTAAAIAGPRAFAQAGLRPSDIDIAQIYDSFTITVLMMLEGLGFCARGEGGAFVSDGKLRPGGTLPTNTDGGALASCHPGLRGIFLLIEAVLQLRGQARGRQVTDAKLAMACGSGGILSCVSAVILGSEQP